MNKRPLVVIKSAEPRPRAQEVNFISAVMLSHFLEDSTCYPAARRKNKSTKQQNPAADKTPGSPASQSVTDARPIL